MATASTWMMASLHAQDGSPAVINDRDGYTNIRASASKQSEIVGRVTEGEPFTVYPDKGMWWRVRTGGGLTGFIHRSCVSLSETSPASASEPKTLAAPIRVDDATLNAWKQFTEIHESERAHQKADAAVLIRECEKIDLQGVDPTVASHITVAMESYRQQIAVANQVETSVARVRPMVELRDALRPLGRKLGREVTSNAPEYGDVIGDLLMIYSFSDATKPKDLPSDDTLYREVMNNDRLLVEEGLIDTALGLNQPTGLKRLLGYVLERAFTLRLQVGRWVLRDADNHVADLEMRIDPKALWNAGGWVTMHWRENGHSDSRFQYEFSADGAFRLWNRTGMFVLGGVPPRVLKAMFVRPTILKVMDESGALMYTWEQVSS